MYLAQKLVTLSCLGLGWFSTPVSAEDASDSIYPRLGGNIITRLGYNGDYESDPPLVEADDIFLQVIASPIFRFSERLRFVTEVRVENISPPSNDRFFEDQGLFARILLAEYSASEEFTIHAGKMTPSFALASFAIPGMFGNSYNKEIELIDQVGIGGSYSFGPPDRGHHTLTFNTFFEDTGFTSESFGNNRGRTSIEDGGASNTESFESYALPLEGSDLDALPGLTYKVGFLHRAKGQDGVDDENGVSATLVQELEGANGADWTLIGEVAGLENFEGSADDIVYASAGIVYRKGPWMGILSGTYRPRYVEDGEDFEDYSIQISAEYDLGNGYSLAIAHEFNRDENADNKRLVFRFAKLIDFEG